MYVLFANLAEVVRVELEREVFLDSYDAVQARWGHLRVGLPGAAQLNGVFVVQAGPCMDMCMRARVCLWVHTCVSARVHEHACVGVQV